MSIDSPFVLIGALLPICLAMVIDGFLVYLVLAKGINLDDRIAPYDKKNLLSRKRKLYELFLAVLIGFFLVDFPISPMEGIFLGSLVVAFVAHILFVEAMKRRFVDN